MIKAVFFDAAGILYTRAGPTEAFAMDLLQNAGYLDEPAPEIRSQLLDIRSDANGGKVDHQEYWNAYLLAWKVNNPDERGMYIHQIVQYSNDVQPITGARQALLVLKSRNLKLGIITDTMYPVEWKMARLQKAGVADLIDIVSCSTSLGTHKPDPAVYQFAITQTPFHPAECAFVGHAGVELDGARSTGMVTIAINQDADSVADYYCESLLDLPELPIYM